MISFAIQDISIDICSELQPNSAHKRKKLFKYTFVIIAIVFSMISLCGYLTLYDKEGFEDIENYFLFILAGLHKKVPLVLVSSYILMFAFLFDCMLNLIPLTKFIDEYVARKLAENFGEREVHQKTLMLKLSFMTTSFSLIVLVVWFSLDIQTLLNALSNFTLPWVFFILPLASYFVTFEKREYLNRRLFVGIGACFVLLGLMSLFVAN